MNAKAHAKINLCLDIVRKRKDGYHEVRMVMQPLELHDHITLTPTADPGITMTMEPAGSGIPTDDRNLMIRAAGLLQESCGLKRGLRMHLKKRIPSEAGLGGGSADAAAVLTGMNQLFQLGLSRARLMELGLSLGADVPFCILGETALSEGIGEALTPVSMAVRWKKCPVLLVKPLSGASTAAMYRASDEALDLIHPDPGRLLQALLGENPAAFLTAVKNSFEDLAIPMIPEIGTIRALLLSEGAFAACMSGSGSTVFGLFEDRETCGRAAAVFRSRADALNLSHIIETSFM